MGEHGVNLNPTNDLEANLLLEWIQNTQDDLREASANSPFQGEIFGPNGEPITDPGGLGSFVIGLTPIVNSMAMSSGEASALNDQLISIERLIVDGVNGGLSPSARNELTARIEALLASGSSTLFGGPTVVTPLEAALSELRDLLADGRSPAEAIVNANEAYEAALEAVVGPEECFPAGTLIDLPGQSSRPIEQIVQSDVVSAFDSSCASGRGALTPARVVRLYENVTDCFVRLEFPDGREPLHVTPGHRFLDETGGFTEIGDLLKLGGDTARVIDATGEVITVTGSVIHFSEETAHLFERASVRSMSVNGNTIFKHDVEEGWKTYNFEVEGLHTYVAGGVRVHNKSTTYTLDSEGKIETLTGPNGESIEVSGNWTPSQAYHYGRVVEVDNGDGTTTPTLTSGNFLENLSAFGRSFADLIGLDGRLGLQGTFANPYEGIDGPLHEEGQPTPFRVDWSGDQDGDGIQDWQDQDYSNIGHWGGDRDGDGIPNWRDHNDGVGWRDNNPGGEGDTSGNGKPIILDLDGDGIEINVNGDVSFDMDADGYLESTAWVSPDDAFLVIDLNADGSRGAGDGKINMTQELAFTEWLPTGGVTDLQALAMFDTLAELGGNGDGVLSSADTVWSELRVWQDINSNGIADAGELKTLDELGFTQINLTYDDGTAYDDNRNDVTIADNTLLGTASYTRNGEVIEGGVGDVALNFNTEGWRRVETADGYDIEFETGARLRYAEMDGTGSAHVDANAANLDGVFGDARDNALTASGHSRDVVLSGGDGADTITGGHGNDRLSGGDGADELRGGFGNDLIFFDASDTVVDGGWGYDTAVATGTAGVTLDLADKRFQVAHGSEGNDSLDGGMHDSDLAVNLHGGAGNDTLRGSNSDDLLSGDAGNDRLEGSNGDDVMIGGEGHDTLHGHSDDDVMMGGAGNDKITGGSGDDMALGGEGQDTITGDDGDDYLDGGAGNDSLDGGTGDDVVLGGAGDDTINGSGGDDVIDGGAGNDELHTHWGDDLVRGGTGNDTVHVESWGDKHVEAGEGDDHIHISASSASHEILGGKGEDKVYLTGQQSDYEITYLGTGAGDGVHQYQILDPRHQVILVQDVEAIVFADGTHHWLSNSDVTQDNSESFYRPEVSWDDGRRMRDDYVDLGGADGTASYYRLRAGDDTMRMTSGNDTGIMDAGEDALLLGAGNDSGSGGSGNDTLFGEEGQDTLDGGSGADGLDGGNGHDSLDGSSGADIIQGGEGNDTINAGSGADVVTGDGGDDSIQGGSGSDILNGGAGNDTILGQDGSDRLSGGDGNDSLEGNDGADRLKGGAGDDTLTGDLGNDRLEGGAGDDTLTGDLGNDRLEGGDGHDSLNGGRGNDVILGGDGNDRMDGSFGFDQLDGGAGNDTLLGGNLDDLLLGGAGNDSLNGGSDNDVMEGGSGADTIDGGSGIFDLASYASSDAGVTVSLLTGTGTGGHAEGDVLTNIEQLAGSEHDDRLDGDNGDNRLFGAAGNDSLYGHDGRDDISAGDGDDYVSGGAGDDRADGGAGADRLDGGSGNDSLYGGAGSDSLTGGIGADELTGGFGTDTFIFDFGDGQDAITDFEDGTDLIDLTATGLSFADLTITDSAEGVVVSYAAGDSITLSDITAAQLAADDFIFA